jgi:hypothetical protein
MFTKVPQQQLPPSPLIAAFSSPFFMICAITADQSVKALKNSFCNSLYNNDAGDKECCYEKITS